MAVKLHRCSWTWLKAGFHPCWNVQKALDDAGVDYEVVAHPALPRGARKDYIALTGEKLLPAIELADGTIVREQSKDMVAKIKSGQLP